MFVGKPMVLKRSGERYGDVHWESIAEVGGEGQHASSSTRVSIAPPLTGQAVRISPPVSGSIERVHWSRDEW